MKAADPLPSASEKQAEVAQLYSVALAQGFSVDNKFSATGIKGFLEKCYAAPSSSVWGVKPANTAAAAHIITPAPQYMDRGKTRIQMKEV